MHDSVTCGHSGGQDTKDYFSTLMASSVQQIQQRGEGLFLGKGCTWHLEGSDFGPLSQIM